MPACQLVCQPQTIQPPIATLKLIRRFREIVVMNSSLDYEDEGATLLQSLAHHCKFHPIDHQGEHQGLL
ncbi:MAG: hypothetical protein R2865_17785 [Deinococcales bacterium]